MSQACSCRPTMDEATDRPHHHLDWAAGPGCVPWMPGMVPPGQQPCFYCPLSGQLAAKALLNR